LRYAFWIAGTVAIRMPTAFGGHSKTTFARIRRTRIGGGDATPRSRLRWLAYAVVTTGTGTDYRRFPEGDETSHPRAH
jgi:hypothetical protein